MSPFLSSSLFFIHLLLFCLAFSPDLMGTDESDSGAISIAICQTRCVDGDREGNMARIEKALMQAGELGAQIACLPETAILGWVNPEAHELAHPVPGKSTEALAEMAKKHDLWICCGMAEKGKGDGDDVPLYDSVVLIDNKGELQACHRKINVISNLMDPPYTAGQETAVTKTPFGSIGLLVCADSFDAEVLKSMAALKPDLVLIPYGWAAPEESWPDHGLSLERTVSHAARTMNAPIVGTDVVGEITHGPWKGFLYGGQSVAVDREGKTLIRCADRKEEVRVIRIEIPSSEIKDPIIKTQRLKRSETESEDTDSNKADTKESKENEKQNTSPITLWEIGTFDRKKDELYPHRDYAQDPFYIVGLSTPEKDWPQRHTGPLDLWAGGRAHTFTICFDLAKLPEEGEATFEYSIRPHAGPYDPAAAQRFGLERHRPLIAIAASDDGPKALPSLLIVETPEVAVTSLKPTRDKKALLARVFAISGGADTIKIRSSNPDYSNFYVSGPEERCEQPCEGAFDLPEFGVKTLRIE